MDRFNLEGFGNDQLVMTLLWLMVTGALIWVTDNFLKRFENTMEDGFRKQARNINDSFRVNVTLLLISLSVFGYYRYYLKQDTSQLTSLLDSLLELLYSVGHFILYLLAYIVYGGYLLIPSTDYNPGRPEPDEYVLLGFVVMFSYIVVKRLFFRRVPPLLWAIIVASVMVGFNFISKQYNIDIKKPFKDRMKKDKIEPTENDTIPFAPTDPVIDEPKVKEKKEPKIEIPTAYDTDDVKIYNEQLLTAIENFDRLIQRTRPDEANFIDNQSGYQNAVISHMDEISRTNQYDAMEKLVLDFKKKGLLQYPTIKNTLNNEFCEYYYSYFDTGICERTFAN